jgi:cytochrome c peroxidase
MVKKISLLLLSAVIIQAQSIEQLGEMLFFDLNLSKNKTQNCATCHNPEQGFIDDRDNGIGSMVSLGDDLQSRGARNAPTAAYAMMSPPFHFDKKKKVYKGGQFLDGREKTLAGQAGGPPLNPIEMGMNDKKMVIDRLKENTKYVTLFKKYFGDKVFKNADKGYSAMSLAIEAFEKSKTFAPFDSKYDRYLRDEYDLSVLEDLGRTLFFSNDNLSCVKCHSLKGEDKEGETFSNYEYHNIGVPSNQVLIKKGIVPADFIDHGLLDNPNITDKKHDGKFKVPTLRNIAVTAPYMHNGVFKTLRGVMEFYDKYNNKERVNNPETGKPWAKPEVNATINLDLLKAKKLTKRKIDALIAFMKLLTDKRYEHLLEEKK